MPQPDVPCYFEVAEGYAVYAPFGEVSLTEAVEMVTGAIAYCRARDIAKLLVNISRLTGYSPPTLHDRYWMVQDWSAAAQGAVVVAMVARAEHIHPEKFGVRAAVDAGMAADVFTTQREALEWLLKTHERRAQPASSLLRGENASDD